MTTVTNPAIVTKIENGCATLTLNRPELHNAFDDTLIRVMTQELVRLEADPQARVVVLAGSGKSFSAGGDLNWMRRVAGYTEEQNLADARELALLMSTLNGLKKPTVALVQGAAYGGGVGLVACCDIALATARASFCLSEVKLGLIPAVISPYVVAAVGARAARRYFLSAETFDAAEALRLGLIHAVVEDGALEAAGERMVQRLLQNGPCAVAAAKELVARVGRGEIDEAMIADTASRIAAIRASEEGREGVSAFLEKRKPYWVE